MPSKNHEIRMMFCAQTKYNKVDSVDNKYTIAYTDEIEVEPNKWVFAKDLKIGDKIFTSDNNYDIIKNINYNSDTREYCLIV